MTADPGAAGGDVAPRPGGTGSTPGAASAASRGRSRVAWAAAVTGVVIVALTLAATLGIPAAWSPAARSSLANAVALGAVTAWWVVAGLAARDWPVRFVSGIGVAAALAGAAAAGILALVGLGAAPYTFYSRSIVLNGLQTPLWALVALAWPGAQWRRPPAVLAVDAAIVLVAGGVLFWDFLIRPAGGLPGFLLARLALGSWALVIIGICMATLRNTRPELRWPLGFILAGNGLVLATSYLITLWPSRPPAWLSTAAGAITPLLWLGAAASLRGAAGERDPEMENASEPGGESKARLGRKAGCGPAAASGSGYGRAVLAAPGWVGVAAAALLLFHVVVLMRTPEPGPAMIQISTATTPEWIVMAVLATSAALLVVLTAVRVWMAARARSRAAIAGAPDSTGVAPPAPGD